tara:strand:- start:1368 stop:1550 length:183 start_codon:yes stop_codon:yes gene_type:complete
MNKHGNPNIHSHRNVADNLRIDMWADRYSIPIYMVEEFIDGNVTKEEFLESVTKYKEKLL